MISEKITKAILKAASIDNINAVIISFMEHLDCGYDYHDSKKAHILEMLVNTKAIININDIDADYLKSHIHEFIYKGDEYIIKDINIDCIDNIECLIIVSYKYKKKDDENNNDVDFSNNRINISFIDYPKLLKKS